MRREADRYSFAAGMGLLVGVALAAVTGCVERETESSSRSRREASPVERAVVMQKVITRPVRTCGKLCYETEQSLSFRSGGIVQAVHVDRGDTVDGNTVLAQLDMDTIQEEVKSATLAVEKTQQDFQRLDKLHKLKSVTDATCENARIAWKQAEASLNVATMKLEYSGLHAPGAGKVLERLVEPGEVVFPGIPVFLFAPTAGSWHVKADIADRDIPRLRIGDRAYVSFDAHPGMNFPASVFDMATCVDPETGTCEVELKLGKTERRLIAGLMARVVIHPSQEERHLVCPINALVEGTEDKGIVYVYRDGKPVATEIRILAIHGESLLVSEGLTGGEEVVVEGQWQLRTE